MKLAVILARKGSKRIPNKNFKKFLGKQVIEWSLDAAIRSKIFDDIIISTDKDIKSIKNIKITKFIKFKRPQKFSGDNVSTNDAVNHTISWSINNLYRPKYVCCIYACAPLIRSEDIVKAYKIINNSHWDYVFTASKFSYPIERSFKLNNNKSIVMNNPTNYNKRTQLFNNSYHDAGQFYWGQTKSWLSQKPFFQKKSTVFLLPSWRVQDIDDEEDWKIAKNIHEKLLKKN